MRWVAAVLVLALGAPVHAQVASDEFGIERFRLSIDPSGVLDVDSATVPLHKSWSAGVFAGFAHEPLVLYDKDMKPIEALVDRRVTTGLVASVALWDRVQLGAGLDLVGYQHGSDDSPTMEDLPKAGLGDARLVAKLKICDGLAFVPTLTVPAGSARGYLREDGVTFAPAVAVTVVKDQLRFAGNVGYRIKPRVEVAGLVNDDEAFARVGVGMALPAVELMWSTSVASPVTDTSSNRLAVEMLAGAARDVTGNVGVFVAGGVGLQNGFGTPDWRALAGVRISYETTAPVPAPIVVVPAPRPPVIVTPRPVPEKRVIAGRVVDREGRPVVGATVAIEGGAKAIADDNGAFTLEYAGGPVKLVASAPQYESTTVDSDGTAADIVLVRTVRQGQLRGQVLSFSGKPLAATITVNGKAVQTDADGNYAIDLPEGAFEVTIESAKHATQKRTINVKLDGVTVLNVDMRGAK